MEKKLLMSKSKYNGQMSLTGYETLINEILEKNYTFKSYDNLKKEEKHVIMRHDIDFRTEDVLKIADIEDRFSIKAHYFFLVDTDFYNISSKNNKKILNYLVRLGHEIGLHYNPLEHSSSIAEDELNAKKQLLQLENIIQKKIKYISFHRPKKKFTSLKSKFAGRLHTYMPSFFSEIGYVSDSQGKWKYGYPTQNSFMLEEKAIQILIHPEWWRNKKISDRNKVLTFMIKNSKLEFIKNLKKNMKNFTIKDYEI